MLASPPLFLDTNKEYNDEHPYSKTDETPMFPEQSSGDLSNFYARVGKNSVANSASCHASSRKERPYGRSGPVSADARELKELNTSGSIGKNSMRSSNKSKGINFDDFEFLEKIKEQEDEETSNTH